MLQKLSQVRSDWMENRMRRCLTTAMVLMLTGWGCVHSTASAQDSTDNEETTSETVESSGSANDNENVKYELSEEQANALAFYLQPTEDFDQNYNLSHKDLEEKYWALVEAGSNGEPISEEAIIEILGEPGYESSYAQSRFLHYLAIDAESAIQVKVQLYEGEGLYQVTKETRDLSVFDSLNITPEEAIDYHENKGVTYEELLEKLGEPTQTGYFFGSETYEVIWLSRNMTTTSADEEDKVVRYIAVNFKEADEEITSFYSDASYDALNSSEDDTQEENETNSEE